MNWILDHIQLIIVIAGAVAYWLNQRRREKAGEEADYDGDGVPEKRGTVAPNADALEEERRTRRIQEEIRRKIMERRSGTATPPPVLAEEFREVPGWQGEGPRPVVAPPPLDDAVMARQRELQEQYQALQSRRATAHVHGPGKAFPQARLAKKVGTQAVLPAHALVEELRNPASMRRAILLREVLGPPVALR